MHALPMEKHELEFSNEYVCNVLLDECTRHTRTLPLLADFEDNREADLRGLSSFTEAITGT
jgi:hypothetical protein